MKIGVVGAGISGLAISLAAEKAGHEVVIFESESDIGGRMSSIRFGPYIIDIGFHVLHTCLLYTSPSPRDGLLSRMPSSA